METCVAGAGNSDDTSILRRVVQVHSDSVYLAAKAPTEKLFEALLQPLKRDIPKAYDQLMTIPRELWTHHKTNADHVVFDQVTSNLAESTINMIGKEVRGFLVLRVLASNVRGPCKAHVVVARTGPVDTALLRSSRISKIRKR